MEPGPVMMTMDADFLIIASQRITHAGIAYVSPTRSIGDLIRLVVSEQKAEADPVAEDPSPAETE